MNLHIKRLAIQAGCHHATVTDKHMKHWRCTNKDLERFAALIVEACAEVCEKSDRYRGDYFAAKIRELIGGKDVER